MAGSTSGSTFNSTLEIRGDTPAWAPDCEIPLIVSVFPVRTINTTFGSPSLEIQKGGQGDVPITVTNVTGPATDVTYSLPLGWTPSTSVGGVTTASGLAMDSVTFQQVPAGGTQSGSLHFTLPPSTMLAGSYPFSIAMSAFDGVPPNINNLVVPELTLKIPDWSLSPWTPVAPFSLKKGQNIWHARHVNDVLAVPGGVLLASDTGGVWLVSLISLPLPFSNVVTGVLPLSDSWERPDMRSLALGPEGFPHIYAAGQVPLNNARLAESHSPVEKHRCVHFLGYPTRKRRCWFLALSCGSRPQRPRYKSY